MTLKRRLDKLEPRSSTREHAAVCRELWREIRDDRERYSAYQDALYRTLEEAALRVLGGLDDEAFRLMGQLERDIITAHHQHGFPLALPTSLLEAFLERPGDFYRRGYDRITPGRLDCYRCGYGTPYRFWQKPLRGPHAEHEYDFLLPACPLCETPLEPRRSYYGEHKGYPNGKAFNEVPRLILYPLPNSRIDGTCPSDYGVRMPEGWPDA